MKKLSRLFAIMLAMTAIGLGQTAAASSGGAGASAKPAEPRLIGTWHLVSYELHNDAGQTIYPLGEHPIGQIMYDKVGNMSGNVQNPHPPARPTNVTDGAAYEARMSYERYASYYGPYDVDTAQKLVHHHVIGSLMPGWAGTTLTRSYTFDGPDHLTLSAKTGTGDEEVILKWVRAK